MCSGGLHFIFSLNFNKSVIVKSRGSQSAMNKLKYYCRVVSTRAGYEMRLPYLFTTRVETVLVGIIYIFVVFLSFFLCYGNRCEM